MIEFHNSLRAATAVALVDLDADEVNSHVSAQRRINGDGSESWAVFIGPDFADFMTHMFDDEDADQGSSVEEIASRIEWGWDDDWDEIPRHSDRMSGNYSLGSSDFITRSEASQ